MKMAAHMECSDFLLFEETLNKMRILDDKIVYALNTSIPTESFKGQVDATSTCRSLYEQLQENYSQRESAIKNCIKIAADRMHALKQEKDSSNVDITQKLRKEQKQLRLLQSELHVEEILQDRTSKVYYERCRRFYKPPSPPL